jgi:uncharacterized protein YecE (DUF72 family)
LPNSRKTSVERKHPAEQSAVSAPARLFVGTSGWDYPTWKPDFYPKDLPRKRFLSHYGEQLNSCEVNYTFRTLPSAVTVQGWLAQTPAGFRFSFKAPQRITHYSRLRDCEQHVEEFLRVLNPVRDAGKLGLVLFQLPPNFKLNVELLQQFLALPALRDPDAPRVAFEFRHESWFCPQTSMALAEAGATFCVAESEKLVTPELHLAPGYASFRLRQSGGYKPAALRSLVDRILPLTADRDVYVYFKHENEPTGALNACAFLQDAAKATACASTKAARKQAG